MEKISRNNYEIFFLDYLEGNLDPLKTEELFSFLILHPDLKKELDDYEIITLDNNKDKFENKDILKKFVFTNELSDFNFEQFCVAFIEGDLNEVQKSKFDRYLKSNPEKVKIFEQFELSRLKADESIIFFGKDRLKRGPSTGIIILKRLSVAASMLFVAGLSFFLLNREDSTQTNLVAENQISTEVVLPKEVGNSVSSVDSLEKTSTNIAEENIVLTSSYTIIKKDLNEVNIQLERINLKPLLNREPDLKNPGEEKIFFASMGIKEDYQYNEPVSRDLLANLRENIDEFGSAINTDGIDGSGRLTIWDIADVGINGFSRLTGANIRIDKKRDDQGNVTALAFQSKNLNFSKRINY